MSAQHSMANDYKQVITYIETYQNEKASTIVDSMIQELKSKNKLETAFGIKVRVREAELLEKNEKNELALKKLLEVGALAMNKKMYIEAADINLSLARLYEKIGLDKECREKLDFANQIIIQYSIDSLYPRYYIRQSSYHRIYADRDSAELYTKQALQSATSNNQETHIATAHMLSGFFAQDSSDERALWHYEQAAEYWQNTGDYNGYGAMMRAITTIYLDQNNTEEALKYNNLNIKANRLAKTHSINADYVFYDTYHKRAEIYDKMQMRDSAMYYYALSYKLETEYLKDLGQKEILLIKEQYENQIEENLLAEQQKIIKDKTFIQRLLTGLLTLLLLGGFGILYYYRKLSKQQNITKKQSETITNKNDQLQSALASQNLLMSEIHHCVKNNLQVIIGLIELQIENESNPKIKANSQTIINRIFSISALHERLYQERNFEKIRLDQYIDSIYDHFKILTKGNQSPLFQHQVADISLDINRLMPIGIIITELITNSIKHGNQSGRQLVINTTMTNPNKNNIKINYSDNGPGYASTSLDMDTNSSGFYLIKSMVRQMQGHIELHNDSGAHVTIVFNNI